MASFLQRLFGSEKASKELAKDRLKLVLIHDRASLSPAMMDNLRRDLVEVISKYMDFDEAALDVQMAEQENMTMLEVNIPGCCCKAQCLIGKMGYYTTIQANRVDVMALFFVIHTDFARKELFSRL